MNMDAFPVQPTSPADAGISGLLEQSPENSAETSPDDSNQEKPYMSMAYDDAAAAAPSSSYSWSAFFWSVSDRFLSLTGVEHIYKQIRKYSFSFIGIHYMYIIGMSIVTSVILYADRGDRKLDYIDALFFGAGACTQAGLNTVNVGDIYLYQQIVLLLVSFITSIVTIHSAVVFVRIYWFQKHFDNIEANSKLQSRLRRTATMARASSQDHQGNPGFMSYLSNRILGTKRPASSQTKRDEDDANPNTGSHIHKDGSNVHNHTHGDEESINPGLVPQAQRNIQFGALPNPRRHEEIQPEDMFKSISMMQQTRRESADPDLTDGPALVIKSPRDIAREYERRRAEKKRLKAAAGLPDCSHCDDDDSNLEDEDRNISLIAETRENSDTEITEDDDEDGGLSTNSDEDDIGGRSRSFNDNPSDSNNEHELDNGLESDMPHTASNKLRFDPPQVPRRYTTTSGHSSRMSAGSVYRTNTQGQNQNQGHSSSSGPKAYYRKSQRRRRRSGRSRVSKYSSDEDNEDEHTSMADRYRTRSTLNKSLSLDRLITRTRSNASLARTNSRGMRTNYLSWEPTVGRNSAFVGLTKEQREELGGVEYRALKLLAKILICYNVLIPIFGMVCLLPWANVGNHAYKKLFGEHGFNSSWWAIFSSVSSFADLGLTLTPDSFISFQHQVFVLLVSSFLILTGNTGFPCFLRLILWILFKITPKYGVMHENLGFLLDHPRRCFTLLFPSSATWWLLFVLIILNGLDWFFFMVVDLGSGDIIASIPTGFRTMCGLYQAIATRTAGFAVVPLGSLHPAVQVSYLIMMYISVFPVAISMRRTNVYEEQSLGVYYDAEEVEEANNSGEFHPSYVQVHLRKQLSFDLWFIFLGLFIICLCESGHIRNKEYDVFAVLFEVVSAYGTVGLSLGYTNYDPSLSGKFNVLSKLVIIAMMIRGRHRGLPYALDRAIMLKGEELKKTDLIQQERTIRKRVLSSAVPIADQINQVGGLATGVELYKAATMNTTGTKHRRSFDNHHNDAAAGRNSQEQDNEPGSSAAVGMSTGSGSGSVRGLRDRIRRDLFGNKIRTKHTPALARVPSQVITE